MWDVHFELEQETRLDRSPWHERHVVVNGSEVLPVDPPVLPVDPPVLEVEQVPPVICKVT